jgi:hypothetical protein
MLCAKNRHLNSHVARSANLGRQVLAACAQNRPRMIRPEEYAVKHEAVIQWAKGNVEPVKDYLQNDEYRCDAMLTDGTIVSCLVKSSEVHLHLALGRFDETAKAKRRARNSLGSYEQIVSNFINKGNHVNVYDVQRLNVSLNAIPLKFLSQIKNETRMSWTQFSLIMNDGNRFGFGTSFYDYFFSFPPNYTIEDIREIVPHEVTTSPVYREKPFFEMYIPGLLEKPIYDSRYKHKDVLLD